MRGQVVPLVLRQLDLEHPQSVQHNLILQTENVADRGVNRIAAERLSRLRVNQAEVDASLLAHVLPACG